MEIDVTDLLNDTQFDPWCLCNSRANLGQDAASITWRNALELARAKAPNPLDTDDKREAFREFVKSSGGWSEAEIAAWSDAELNALFVQWLAGDVRETFGEDTNPTEATEAEWAEAEEAAKRGQAPGCIWRGSGGRVFFYIGS